MKAILIILLVTLTGCPGVTRREVEATIWLNNTPIPNDICEREPELKSYGFYRRLNDGKFEFMSFCNPEAVQWLSIHKDEFFRFMDKLLPEPKDQ